MALINTLRNKLGKFIVAAVAIAILSFVLADLLGPNSAILGGGNDVGEIAGKTISLKEYQETVQEMENNYILNFNRQPTEREKPTIRQQAWDLLIARYAYEKEYEKVGSMVTDEEIWDMIQGQNINPTIEQSFVNPETGQFDRERLLGYLQQLPSLPANAQVQWELFKTELITGRKRLKYEYLLTKSNYVTSAEAKREYNMQNDVAEIKYLYVPYYSISDTTITVSESEIKDYYNKNKEQFKVDESRSLSYVTFDVVPSSDDTLFVKEELQLVKEEFKTAVDDSTYASLNTDGTTFFSKYHAGTLPLQLKANISNLTKGDVRGPYLTAEGFTLYKVSDIYEDTVGYAKASHILIKGDDDEAKEKARDILKQIKNGADFAAMAREHGTDGTATRGGDLGWFESGRMVAPFEKAVFAAKTTGVLDDVVKTEFGYHIIKVDEVKTNTSYKVATVSRNVLPGDETINNAYTKADLFAASVDDFESFTAQAKADSLTILGASKLKPNDRRVSSLGDARQIVQWLFNDASKGEVSDVFELDNTYAVAVMTEEIEKGYKEIKDVTAEISIKLKNEAKGKQIIEKLNSLTGSLDEKAAAYGSDANVYNTSNLLMSSNSIPSVGFDPMAIGKAFSLESGQTSAPFGGENGVLIITLENKTIAPEIADYTSYKNQIKDRTDSRVAFGISEAIKEAAKISDERYRFY